jgi:hypothetical protein
MRRSILLVMVALLMVVAGAGVALAVTKTCTSVPCRGTSADDVLRERIGDGKRDVIYGLRGSDRLDAGGSLRSGPAETDLLYGGGGRDWVWVVDEDFHDKARGGPGENDRCFGDTFRESMPSCEKIFMVVY